MLIKWWLLLESNQRHQDFQSCALPTELRSHKLVARGRFELPHARVKVVCLTAWLPGNNGGADGGRTRVQKIFTNHKSHSYLTGFVYIVLSLLFTIYKSQEQVLILRSFTTVNLLERVYLRGNLC